MIAALTRAACGISVRLCTAREWADAVLQSFWEAVLQLCAAAGLHWGLRQLHGHLQALPGVQIWQVQLKLKQQLAWAQGWPELGPTS